MSGIDAVGRHLEQLGRDMARKVLKAQGSALIKPFEGSGFNEPHAVRRQRFAKVRMLKSAAARAHCPEPYLLAKDFTIV